MPLEEPEEEPVGEPEGYLSGGETIWWLVGNALIIKACLATREIASLSANAALRLAALEVRSDGTPALLVEHYGCEYENCLVFDKISGVREYLMCIRKSVIRVLEARKDLA